MTQGKTRYLDAIKKGFLRVWLEEDIHSRIGSAPEFALADEAGCLAVKFHTSIWAETIDEQEIRYPADWWQAVKQRWFPEWALRRWPVVEQVHRISWNVEYPRIPTEWGRGVRRVRVDSYAIDPRKPIEID